MVCLQSHPLQMKQNVEAEKYYEAAVGLQPKSLVAHSNLGAIYHLNGKYSKAKHSYSQALQIKPDDSITLTNLAKLKQLIADK